MGQKQVAIPEPTKPDHTCSKSKEYEWAGWYQNTWEDCWYLRVYNTVGGFYAAIPAKYCQWCGDKLKK